jgi:uncharacterized protein YodC (DUF2158 family)
VTPRSDDDVEVLRRKVQPGDIVRLVSGGPEMVVIDCGFQLPMRHRPELTLDAVRCVWYDAQNRSQCESFPEMAVTVVGALPKETLDR